MTQTYPKSSRDETTLGLLVAGWIVSEPSRAERMLALTGLDPVELRANLAEPAMLCALIDFLCNHEPDLIACAAELDVEPAQIVAARSVLGGEAGAELRR